MYEMDLWELNACIRAFNRRVAEKQRERVSQAWQIGNFVGAAFAGKLKSLNHYVEVSEGKDQGVALTREQMEDFDRRMREQRGRVTDGI